MKRILKKLCISLLSLLVMVLLAELALRVAEPGPLTFRDTRPYVPHDELMHVHEPGFTGTWDGSYYEINELGFRGPELPEPAAGDYRILAIGDSCTFGKGVAEEESYPRQLEARLLGTVGSEEGLPEGTRPVVANLGVNGFGGYQYQVMYREFGRPLKPNLVLLGYNINDFPNPVKKADFEVFQGKGSLRARVPWKWRKMATRLALGRFLRHTWYEWNKEKNHRSAADLANRAKAEDNPDMQIRLDQQAEILRETIESIRADGAEVVVFLFPYESQVVLDSYDAAPLDFLAGICEGQGASFLGMVDPFRAVSEEDGGSLFIYGDRYHPNGRGYGIIADELREHLATAGWPGKTGP